MAVTKASAALVFATLARAPILLASLLDKADRRKPRQSGVLMDRVSLEAQ